MSTGTCFDALVEHRAAPITALIASRVKALREDARLSGAALAKLLNKHGVMWNRTTVIKLEAGARESLTVQELLALALVLEVPPVALLADPLQMDEVPIAKDLWLTTWDALGWITGAMAIDPRDANVAPDPQAGWALRQLLLMSGALEEIARAPDVGEVRADDGQLTDDPATVRAVVEQRERSALETIRDVLARIGRAGVAPPAVPPYIARRADALGVDLGPHGRDWLAEPHRGGA